MICKGGKDVYSDSTQSGQTTTNSISFFATMMLVEVFPIENVYEFDADYAAYNR